jgi:hypothetical protein
VVGSGVRTPAAAFAEMPRRLDTVFSEPSIQVAIQRKLWGLWNRPLSDSFMFWQSPDALVEPSGNSALARTPGARSA